MDLCMYILQKQGKEDGVGGWGLKGTPIDMFSFYLPNEFFFSSEWRRHSETTLHHKKKKKRSEHIIWANTFIVATELFPFLMKRLLMNLFPGQFVPLHCASLQCIVLRFFFFFFFFFQPVRKTVIAMKRIWWHIIYISSLQSSEKL